MTAIKRLLLDTHVFIWYLENDKKMKREAYEVINDPDNLVFVSAATLWEISIKQSIGKLALPKEDLLKELEMNRFEGLPITPRHAILVKKLPLLHGDPFDRILITQAKAEDLTLITRDPKILQYKTLTVLA